MKKLYGVFDRRPILRVEPMVDGVFRPIGIPGLVVADMGGGAELGGRFTRS